MSKELLQTMSAYEGWEAVFVSYNNGELFWEPIVCWAFVSETPHVQNGRDEAKYIEGMVVINNGIKIGGINETPNDVGFLGYLYTKLPKNKIKELMDHYKELAQQLMKIRESRHRLAKKSRRTKRRKKKS